MLPNNPNNISFFSNETFSSHQETTPPFSMRNSLMNNYQIQTSESPSKDSSSCPVRKRPHRTDRHSKILTAQGERDRRMRLSVQVARQFFALQDRLGFDTASQTLDWLLNQAKESIDQTKSISELVHEETMLNNGTYANPNAIIIPDQIHAMMPEKMSKTVSCTQGVTKDSREKARFRARERTKEKEKMKMKKGVDCTLDQLVLNASVSVPEMDGNYGNELEYYYYLTEILNGNLDDCGMEIEDHYKGELTSGMQFN